MRRPPIRGCALILFTNDYNRGAHPAVLQAIADANESSFPGYGADEICARAAGLIRAALGGADADVHFLVGGTQVNYTIIAAALRPWQSVLSADTGHIAQHEAGAVEHAGHKVEVVPGVDGKLSAAQVERAALDSQESTVAEHITQPALVYLSQPTEFGTLYSRDELAAISRTAHEHGLLLFIDGARLAYGLGSPGNDVAMADMAALADVFTIGGTKCGALFGEAAVLVNPALRTGFRNQMKQNGAMLAKGWLLGLQFEALFTDGLYRRIGAEADARALRIARVFAEAGVPAFLDSPTNQQFVVLTSAQLEALSEGFGFEYWQWVDEDHHCVRFCTSWSTRDHEVGSLAAAVAALPADVGTRAMSTGRE